jgi:zinc transport system substrate-binding protein
VHLEDHGDLGEGDSGSHGDDPHIWLDPVDFQKVGDAVAGALAQADPAHAADYRANAAKLDAQFVQLDADYKKGLASCRRKDIVTSHAAFGYLVENLIRAKGVTTAFFETLASPKTAQSLAKDTGTKAAVLDPIEGVADPAKNDYLSVMRDNLAALQTALGCS